MTIPASHCEAVLRGMSKRADKEGDWIEVKFQLHPNEVPKALWNADLRSRWQLAFVEIGDDEQPKAPAEKPKRPPATTRAEKARRLCGIREFQDWIINRWPMQADGEDTLSNYQLTSNRVKFHCGVDSKNELDANPEIAKAWDTLLSEYEQQTGRMAERH